VFDYVDGIQIVNNSNQGQIICYSCFDSIGSIIDSLTMTPYFKQFDNFKPEIINKDAFINKNSSQGYRISGRKETIVRFCPDKHVRFFFISDSVFMNNPWDTIVKYQMYNRKLVFSEKDLKENDWTVVYE
jgi:formate-dependent nitrite reductase cytochrome c552 subunit